MAREVPHNEEAERAVLGSLLQGGAVSVGACIQAGVTVDSFYIPAHVTVFQKILELHSSGRPVDATTVGDRVRAANELEQVGGAMFVIDLLDDTPTSAALDYWVEQVREKERMRKLLDVCRSTAAKIYEGVGNSAEILSRAVAGFDKVSADLLREKRTNADVMDSLLSVWQRAYDMRRDGGVFLPGLETPYARFNELLGGLQPGLHFIGGKSSAGKTSFVLNICNHLLLNGRAGLIIQLDDTHEDVIGRMVSMMAGCSLPALSHGFAKRDALEKIKTDTAAAIRAMPLHVIEECADVTEMRALARYYHARHKIEWLVVDYVQVLDGDNPRDDERIRLGKIATVCKRLWKELRIPVIVVSQVARTKDSEDTGMKADMSDLFGASELFHAATSVFILKAVRRSAGRGEPLVPVVMPFDDGNKTFFTAVAGHVVKNKHGAKDCMVMFWALLKYFKFVETNMVESGGITRQQTWEEEIEESAMMKGKSLL